MEKEDEKIVGHYEFSQDQNSVSAWAELSGLKIPLDKLFVKFALKKIVILNGADVLRAMEDSGRSTDSFESFRGGYLTPPLNIGKLSILDSSSAE